MVFAFLSIVMLWTRPFCFNLSDSAKATSRGKDLSLSSGNLSSSAHFLPPHWLNMARANGVRLGAQTVLTPLPALIS